MMIDICELNKISKFDVYFMFLQFDIIFSMQKCKFISIMNCVAFFHQWRIVKKDKHKLIVITHKEFEQWNVTMMNWRNSSIYVQRKINNIFREYLYIKAYIDNVIIFSNLLKEYLNYFNVIFFLFYKWEITLKASKTYFEYFNISLLEQKIDSFELSMSSDKLKVIIDLTFSKTLKELKTYLKITNYLYNYVFCYVQKAKPLQAKKTKLLKYESIKSAVRKNFNKRKCLKKLNNREINSYKALRKNFNRLN